MKAITEFQFFDIVKSMKSIYEEEIGKLVPKFEVLNKKELFPIDITTVYECELYTINICKKYYYLNENHSVRTEWFFIILVDIIIYNIKNKKRFGKLLQQRY